MSVLFWLDASIAKLTLRLVVHRASVHLASYYLRSFQNNIEFHGVTYHPDVIPYAVKASVRYISDRFLPDKAIDLVDEAGAYREIHPIPSGEQIVDKTLITDVLARICKVDALAMKEEDTTSLETLHARISAKIYGQEEAVRPTCSVKRKVAH